MTLSRRRVGFVLVVLGSILIAAWVIHVGLTIRSLQEDVNQLRAVAAKSDIAAACQILGRTEDDVRALQSETGVLIALAPLFRWMPSVGNDLDAVPHLVTAANPLMDAGSTLCDAFSRSGVRDLSLVTVARALADNPSNLQQAAAAVAKAERGMSPVQSDALSPLLSSRIATVQRLLPLGRGGLELAGQMSWLAGFDRPRTYLLVALNEDELRPGGGFISGVGQVQVDAGRVTAMVFRDSYAVDDFTKPYPVPPEPLTALQGIDQWVFRDANWSPDFPTAARQAIELYRPSGALAPIDGVIAVDQRAFQELVGAVGPLQLPDVPEPVTGANAISYMRRSWAPSDGNVTGDWWLKRKSFMGPLAEAMRGRIETGAFDKMALAQTLLRLLEGKHIQVFVNQPDAAAVLHAQGWDGSLARPIGDYLMVVDANLGYNKVNANVRQSLTYHVDLRASPPRGEISLVYTNTTSIAYPCVPEIRYDPVYDQMANRCYWDYVRVLVPFTTRLDEATRIPVAASALWRKTEDSGVVTTRPLSESNLLSLEAIMVLPTTSSQTRRYTLTLGDSIVQWDGNIGTYRLQIQKQAGTSAYPVVVSVDLPEAAALLEAQPWPAAIQDRTMMFQFSLDRDYSILLRFERRR